MIKMKIHGNPYHRNRKAHCLTIMHFIFAAACIEANLGYFNCRNYRFVLSLETPGKKEMCVTMNSNVRVSLVFWQRLALEKRERAK